MKKEDESKRKKDKKNKDKPAAADEVPNVPKA